MTRSIAEWLSGGLCVKRLSGKLGKSKVDSIHLDEGGEEYEVVEEFGVDGVSHGDLRWNCLCIL